MNKIDKRYLKTFKKIKERAKNSSLIWLNQNDFFKEYPKIKKSFKLKLICLKCNVFFERSVWTHLSKDKYNCPGCVGNKKLTFNQFLRKFIQNKLNKKFWILFDKNWWKENYKNTFTKINLKCKICKKELNIDVNNLFYQNVGCNNCAQLQRSLKNQKITRENFLKKAKEIHGDKYDYSLITEEWWLENFKGPKRTTYVKIPLICKKHGKFFTTISKHISQQSGCPKCYASKGEQKILRFLEKNKINFIYQYSIKNFRFDFYLPKYKIFIEYDGKQHFEPIEFFGYENFIKTQKSDKNKELFCNQNNFHLIRIKYTYFKELEKYLIEALKVFGMKFEDD